MNDLNAICVDCNYIIPNIANKCENCGSNRKIMHLSFSENMNLRERVKEGISGCLKDRTKTGKKKETLKFFKGHDKRKSQNDWVNKERIIDIANDRYYELVETLDGGKLRECDEKLSEHQGHGSAKFEKIT